MANPVNVYSAAEGRGVTYSQGIFEGLKKPYKNNYALTRGASDFGNMSQYNLYEKGYPFLILVSVPECLSKLTLLNGKDYTDMVNAYFHLLEHEFKGIEGLEAISSEATEISDGLSSVEMITKVTMQSASTFTMRFWEKAGSTINKVHELYLRGIKDPRTGFKHYNGLIPDYIPNPGFEKEVFSFLYFVTDNTGLALERAFYIVSAQITSSDLTMYEGERGTIEFSEVSVEFRGYPLIGRDVNLQAEKVLRYINSEGVAFSKKLHRDSATFHYTDNNAPLTEEARNTMIKEGRPGLKNTVNEYHILTNNRPSGSGIPKEFAVRPNRNLDSSS